MNKLSIVIPAWNEEKTLAQMVEKVISIKYPHINEIEVIIVNDGSTDSTWEIMKDLEKRFPEVHAFSNEKNSGKSQTVKNGILKTTGDVVVIQDADFEYEPNEISDLLNLMVQKDLDVVYGNRFGKKNKVIYWQNYMGNKFLSFVSNVFTYPRIKVWIPDMEVCYKLMNGEVARAVGGNITSTSRFGLEPEVTAKLSRYKLNGKHLKFGIVSISYFPRSIAEGKKMSAFDDGYKAIKEILKFNF